MDTETFGKMMEMRSYNSTTAKIKYGIKSIISTTKKWIQGKIKWLQYWVMGREVYIINHTKEM